MKDTLVMYFGGNHPANSTTKRAATSIADLTGADLFEIEPKYPYSTNDDVCVQEALRDLGANARPELARPVPNIEQYSTIILGFPNWCGTAPMPVLRLWMNFIKRRISWEKDRSFRDQWRSGPSKIDR